MSHGAPQWPWVIGAGPAWLQSLYRWYRNAFVCWKGQHEWHAAGPNAVCEYCGRLEIYAVHDQRTDEYRNTKGFELAP